MALNPVIRKKTKNSIKEEAKRQKHECTERSEEQLLRVKKVEHCCVGF